MEEAGMGLPNPIFIPVTHRAKLCKPGRATNRGTKERTLPPPSPSFTNVYTRFASSVRSVLYPWTISLPRLSWLIVSQLRESGGAKVRIRGGNEGSPLISHQIRGRDWPGNRSKRFWKEQCTHARDLETWRGREWKKSSRFEKYFTFPPIFTHFSRHFIFRSLFQRGTWTFCPTSRFIKLTQPRDSSNWFIRYTVNHRKDEYVRRSTTNSGITFEQRTGKRDFVIARCELVLHILFTQLRYAP